MEFILEREASGRLLPKFDARVIKTEIYLDTAMDYVQVFIPQNVLIRWFF